MKRMIVAGLLALAALVGTQQKASAWCRWNFNAGINWNYEGGGNSLLWGLYQSSPAPGCGVPGCVLQGAPFNNTNCCQAMPGPALAYPGYSVAPVAPAPAAPHPTSAPAAQTAVHPASYSTTGYYPYDQPNYYSGQVPSYWYGR